MIDREMDTYWQVGLSDGTIAEQDDSNNTSTWILLGEFLAKNPDVRITYFDIRFRDNVISLPQNMPGYYFAKGALQAMNGDGTIEYYVVGWIEQEDTVHLQWIKTPELIVMNDFARPLSKCKPPCLISFLTNPSAVL